MEAAAQRTRRFDPVGTLSPSAGTAPAAAPPEPAEPTPRRRDVKTPGRQDATASEPRVAYTWRLTRDQYDQLDQFNAAVRDEADRIRLDRAEMLTALLDQLADDPAYAKKVARRLDTEKP